MAKDEAFFENNVRPLLIEKCHACHSVPSGKAKGGLQLDSQAALMQGGDRGPAVNPGRPGDSLLIKAIRQTDPELRMPPSEKLTDAQIAVLEAWVKSGAPFPAKPVTAAHMPGGAAAKAHWAFQPVKNPEAPAVRHSHWSRTGIDKFVLAKIESRGWNPSPQADKRTLLRRAYFDLIGLPPTFEDIRAFEQDESADAFARVIDRLLASPRYGERWGRHWLDVARYADTKDGVLMYGDDRMRPFAYTYRDYVIRSLNDDVPFDRFVHEQIAADLIEPKVEPWKLAALGFLTLGRQYDGNIHDVVDDRIDTVTRGFLGLTVACARCHDHKYDPVPTADYYSLYGVFSACEAPLALPPLESDSRGPPEYEKKHAAKIKEIEHILDVQYEFLSKTARERTADYLVHVATTPPDPMETAIFFFSLDPDALRPPTIARWRQLIAKRSTPDDPIFGPWHELFALPDADFAAAARLVIASLHGSFNKRVSDALAAVPIESKADVARAFGQMLTQVWRESHTLVGPLERERQQLLDLVSGPDSPAFFPKTHTRKHMSRAVTDDFGKKLLELDILAVKEPAAPPRAMAVFDTSERDEPRVFLRGNPARPGDTVPRRFLGMLSGAQRQSFPNGSGRLDLARAITAADNPLTARVIVNRVWMHHFGEPLVDSPNDFGLRSTAPIQAELLDHLAGTFRNDGWSLKKLHRRIMLSATYQQASADRPECRAADPGNRLLWRANRRRLELEAMRDSMLAVSGRLNETMFGRPVNVAGDAAQGRRTVYGLVDRQSLPVLFRAFDFASPDQSAERRPQTTVPQQALFGLNGSFVQTQAKALAARAESEADPAARINALYRLTLQREPDASEVKLGMEFIATQGNDSRTSAWEQLAQVLLLTNEFLFVD